MRPYLSIIIPYYNAPEKLEKLLESLEKSKGASPFEVIVVDDGSDNDAQCTMLNAKWKKKNLRSKIYDLRSIRLPTNKGPAIARNRGVSVGRREFFAFLDGELD